MKISTDTSKISPKPAASFSVFFAVVSLALYYLIPFRLQILGSSPHILTVITGFFFLFLSFRRSLINNQFLLLLFPLFLSSYLLLRSLFCADFQSLVTWLISLMAFYLFCNTYASLSLRYLDIAVQLLTSLWAFAAFAQVTFGASAYISNHFGAPLVTVYATGLTIYSNNAAVMLLPLLLWSLVINLYKPRLTRIIIFLIGSASLYFTMSRSGILAFYIAFLVLFLRMWIRNDHVRLRRTFYYFLASLLALHLSWAAPTRLDRYEPFGNSSAGRWGSVLSTSTIPTDNLDYSSASRLSTLRVGISAVMKHPFTGIGLGNFPSYYSTHASKFKTANSVDPRSQLTPHNGFLQFVAELGIFPFLFVVVFFVVLLYRVGKVNQPDAIFLHLSLVALFVVFLFHDGLYDRLLWILAGSSLSLISTRHHMSSTT
jgi:O-antigen ligase